MVINCCWWSVAKSCLTSDCSMSSFPVPHHLLEFAQVHPLHWWDAIQPSHPLSPLSPSDLNLSSASGSFPMCCLFVSGGQSIGASASVLPMSIQGWFPLRLTGLISLLSKGLSRVFSRPQSESINSLPLTLLYGPVLTAVRDYWKKPEPWLYRPLSEKEYLCFLICCLGLPLEK